MKKYKSYLYFFQYQLPIHFIFLVTSLFPDTTPILKLRGRLLKPFLKSSGKNFQVCRNVIITNTHNVSVGDDVFIGYNSWINGVGGIEIEDEVMIGPFVSISTSSHQFDNYSVRFGGYRFGSIKIGKGSWIAAHCIITAGTQISKGTLVAAGSVVNKSISDEYTVVGGSPAKFLKQVKNSPSTIKDRWGNK